MLPATISTSVRRVHDEDVDLRPNQRGSALVGVRPHADGGADAQAPLRVLRGEWVLDPLLDVLDRDQAFQHAAVVDDRQLLHLVPVQDRLGLGERRPDRRRDEVARGHQVRDGLRDVVLETEVAVREDADQAAAVVDDGYAGDAVALHQRESVGDASARRKGDGVVDHARL
jgi:hypothetical protein